MRSNKKQRTVISVILAFFLAVCLFFIGFCTEVQMGYLGNRTFQDSLLESHYVENAIAKMKEEVTELLEDKSISGNFAEEAIDDNACYVVVQNYVTGALEGRQMSIDSTEFEAALEQYLTEYLNENQIYQTDAVKTTIAEIVNQAGKIYVRYLQPEFAVSFREFGVSMKQILTIVTIAAAVMAVILSVILILLYHYKHRAIRYLMVSAASAVIWNIICAVVIWKSDVTKGIDAEPEYYQEFLKSYVNNGLDEWWIMIAIGVLLFLVLGFVAKYLKHNVK